VDSYEFYSSHDQLPPPPLPLLCQNVCLTGVEYASYLAMHYMRQNPVKGGTIIMTSSGTITFSSIFSIRLTFFLAAGIYASPALPIYVAAKFGVVGLMRSLAPKLIQENIRVNCTLPGVVRTNLCDEDTWNGL
jgi:NAD(P)-dependent dehydrogenase (short-subunit alcohol dehydrogenase family)